MAIDGKQLRNSSVTTAKLAFTPVEDADLSWRQPVSVLQLIGNASIATINGLSPSAGDAYVATDAGTPSAGSSDALVAGSIAEFDGTSWIEIVAGSGGFVPSGTRAVLATQTALVSPYTDTVDDGKVVSFGGASNTGSATGDAVDGYSVLVNGDGGVNENLGYVFSGSVPSGTWVAFGGGVLTAGDGIDIAGGVVSTDLLASGGLKIVSTELAVEPADFAGTGLEDDGSDNLRLASQGNGIAGGAGSTLSVDPDSETGGNTQPVSVGANGVGVDISAIAGTGLEADGSANLRLASQGNGIAGGAGSTLSVDPDSETGGNTQPVSVTANGVGVDISAIAGTGLTADGSANLAVDEATGSVTFTGGTWTYPVDVLQVTGTPNTDNDAVNKSYVDNLVSGSATWRNPVRDSDLVDVVGANPGTGTAVAAAYGITTGDNVAFIATAGFTFDAGGTTVVAVAGDVVNLTMTSPTAGDYSLIEAGPLTTGDRFIVAAEHGTAQGILDGSLGQIDIGGDDATVAAGAFVIGDTYRITTVGTTDFTLIGASANTIGVSFVATGVGAGTGDALDVTNNIKKADLIQFTGTGDGSTAASWSFPEGRSGLAQGETEIPQGTTVLNNDPDSVHYGHTFLYNQDANSWSEISGPGAVGAGAGLSYAGSTLNIGDINRGIQVNADDLEFAASEAIQASSGLKAGTNSWQLAIEPADFAGTGLEDDGSDNLRLASQGNGIAGGAGSTLSVDPDSETGGNIEPVNVTANGVGLDVSAIAGTGLEADGSANLRLAAQGNGISGGAGSTLSVNAANDTVGVTGSGVTSAQPAKGNKSMTASVTTTDNDQATATTVAAAPATDSWVTLLVNGVKETVGDGTKAGVAAYISGDGGTNARAWNDVVATDTIHWNGSVAGYELAATDVLDLVFNDAE
jgi:hypothetical protein